VIIQRSLLIIPI